MSTASTIAYLATSVDSLIAGPDDDLAWLAEERSSGRPIAAAAWARRADGGLGSDELLGRVGCMLMGRCTYDAVIAMGVPWPYRDLPVRVATTQPLSVENPAITPVEGRIDSLVEDALAAVAGKEVYVDGGRMVRATLAAGLLDVLVVTMLPVVLGEGTPLFDATVPRTDLTVVDVAKYGDGLVQIHYRCR
ncbi:MAG: dihydrofolate reductase family protein [Demequina sp.]|nr:dihydrofolate reductase family protein [Demequina sp.]